MDSLESGRTAIRRYRNSIAQFEPNSDVLLLDDEVKRNLGDSLNLYQAHADRKADQPGHLMNVEAFHELGAV